MNFATRLKHLREERELSQIQLAKILNISRQSVSNYENGLRFPNDEKLIIYIANYFNVSIDYLFGTTNIRKSNSFLAKETEDIYLEKNKAIEDLFKEIDNLSYDTIEKIIKTIRLFNE